MICAEKNTKTPFCAGFWTLAQVFGHTVSVEMKYNFDYLDFVICAVFEVLGGTSLIYYKEGSFALENNSFLSLKGGIN